MKIGNRAVASMGIVSTSAVAFALIALLLSGCASSYPSGDASSSLSGTVSLNGSTSMERVVGGLAEAFMSENPDVTLLINCAGMGKKGKIADRDASDIADTVTLNCTALSVLTREVIPFMNRGARIINVGSSAAYLPQPGFTVYAASKSYVVSFSRALAIELKSRGISVTVVCHGPVETEFNKLATDGKSSEFTGFRKLVAADADKLASASLKAARHGRRMFVYGLPNKALHVGAKFIPVGLFLELFYRG